MQKRDQPVCPRHRHFNVFYSKYRTGKFGKDKGPIMSTKLERKLRIYQESSAEPKLNYWLYDEALEKDFIIAIVTPLTVRYIQWYALYSGRLPTKNYFVFCRR